MACICLLFALPLANEKIAMLSQRSFLKLGA